MAVHARSAHFSRRAVLRGGALTIAFALSDHRTELFAQGASRAPRILDPNLVDAFLAVAPDTAPARDALTPDGRNGGAALPLRHGTGTATAH